MVRVRGCRTRPRAAAQRLLQSDAWRRRRLRAALFPPRAPSGRERSAPANARAQAPSLENSAAGGTAGGRQEEKPAPPPESTPYARPANPSQSPPARPKPLVKRGRRAAGQNDPFPGAYRAIWRSGGVCRAGREVAVRGAGGRSEEELGPRAEGRAREGADGEDHPTDHQGVVSAITPFSQL